MPPSNGSVTNCSQSGVSIAQLRKASSQTAAKAVNEACGEHSEVLERSSGGAGTTQWCARNSGAQRFRAGQTVSSGRRGARGPLEPGEGPYVHISDVDVATEQCFDYHSLLAFSGCARRKDGPRPWFPRSDPHPRPPAALHSLRVAAAAHRVGFDRLLPRSLLPAIAARVCSRRRRRDVGPCLAESSVLARDSRQLGPSLSTDSREFARHGPSTSLSCHSTRTQTVITSTP